MCASAGFEWAAPYCGQEQRSGAGITVVSLSGTSGGTSAANAPPAPNTAKVAITIKSRFENKPKNLAKRDLARLIPLFAGLLAGMSWEGIGEPYVNLYAQSNIMGYFLSVKRINLYLRVIVSYFFALWYN
jgi:hypothetical protein